MGWNWGRVQALFSLYSDEIKWFGGVRNLIQFNQVPLGKWLWRYATKTDTLWSLMIDTKYDSLSGDWCCMVVAGPFGLGVWKYRRRGSETFLEVGDGSKVNFWHDA
jgi:hypothetical protein